MPSERGAYDALCCDTLARGDAAFVHQHVVDAFLAQTADAATKPIGLTFALIGLYLHVERGVTGRDVQRAHMQLAKQKREWPRFALPRERGSVTPTSVLAAPPGVERDRAIEGWAASVWSAFREHRQAIEELLRQHGWSFDR
jgi:hypothetical protein